MINKKICYIFGAGPIENFSANNLDSVASNFDSVASNFDSTAKSESFVIAADGGYEFLRNNSIKPNLLIGDFDSLKFNKNFKKNIESDIEVIRFPTVKDDTDMMLAFKEGIKRGYKNFVVYGGMGGKLEFTVANLQILYKIVNEGCTCTFMDSQNMVTAIKNSKVEFDETFRGRISVFAATKNAQQVTIKGLKYELDNGMLETDCPLGVSNEFIGKSGYISVGNGMLCIIYDNSNKKLKYTSQ